ncbi:MAG TPA: hypothetical protein ENN61_04600 [Bacteroidaceae bacterium]|nr:hypothetical protein [Bacteroidaceae bacterium]
MKKIFFTILVASLMVSCKTSRVPVDESPEHFTYNPAGEGPEIEIEFTRGKKHNHPLMAIWIEDTEGQFIQTLYVAESIGKGIFRHGDTSEGFWKPGEIRRPAALPYWSHRRGIKADDGLYIPSPRNPVADAYTGPTPGKSFILHTRLNEPVPQKFYVLFELNQTWDWNEYWTNNKFPDDDEYKTSCQPAIVYSALVDLENPQKECEMQIIGRSHESGANGELYDDLHTLTTALQIAEKIIVRIPGSGSVN